MNKNSQIDADGRVWYRASQNTKVMLNVNPEREFETASKWEIEILSSKSEVDDLLLLQYKSLAWEQACKFKTIKHDDAYEKLLTVEQKNKLETTLEKWSNCWFAITSEINKRAETHRAKVLRSFVN